jgi:hypothetical protein
VEAGWFDVMIGESSEDIVLQESFEVMETMRAEFEYSDLNLPQIEMKTTEKIRVEAVVTGTKGMEEGEAGLYIDGKLSERKKLCLSEGEYRKVSFSLGNLEPGSYSVTIGDLPAMEVIVSQISNLKSQNEK